MDAKKKFDIIFCRWTFRNVLNTCAKNCSKSYKFKHNETNLDLVGTKTECVIFVIWTKSTIKIK